MRSTSRTGTVSVEEFNALADAVADLIDRGSPHVHKDSARGARNVERRTIQSRRGDILFAIEQAQQAADNNAYVLTHLDALASDPHIQNLSGKRRDAAVSTHYRRMAKRATTNPVQWVREMGSAVIGCCADCCGVPHHYHASTNSPSLAKVTLEDLRQRHTDLLKSCQAKVQGLNERLTEYDRRNPTPAESVAWTFTHDRDSVTFVAGAELSSHKADSMGE